MFVSTYSATNLEYIEIKWIFLASNRVKLIQALFITGVYPPLNYAQSFATCLSIIVLELVTLYYKIGNIKFPFI